MVTHHTGNIEYKNDCLMPVETIYTIHILKFSAHQLLTLLACIAIVSVVFEKQRKTEEWDFQCLACAKNGARAKIRKREGKEGRKEGSFPFPLPVSFVFFGSRPIFRASKTPKILFQGLSLLPNPTEMQAIKLWSECSEFYDYVLHVFYLLQLVLVVELLDLPFWKLCCRVW